jgi:hypothetical protein
LEYQIKAGYLFHFVSYVEWPPKSFAEPGSPLVIGVLGKGDALGAIQQQLKGKSVRGHPVEVKALSPSSHDLHCHLLFVTRAAEKSPQDLRSVLEGAATLLVGETDQFAQTGGMIGFVREQETIRLALNLEAATQAGLKVSAKLSSVARVVKSARSDNSS